MAASGGAVPKMKSRPQEKPQPTSNSSRRGRNVFANPQGFKMPHDSANIVLKTGDSAIKVNIGSINGNVSIGAKNRVTTVNSGPHYSNDASSSSSDSSSDSDVDRYLHGYKPKQKHVGHRNVTTSRAQVNTNTRPHVPQQVPSQNVSKLQAADARVAQAMATFPPCNQGLTVDVLRKISSEFEQGWRRVFRLLGVSDEQIDDIHTQFYVDGLKEVVLQLLQCWVQQQNGPPDPKKLAEAVVRARQMHVFNVLKDTLK